MKVITNGRETGKKETGCALCGGTWGSYYEDVEDQSMFFCCDLCAKAFINTVNEVKKRTGWDHLDQLELKGNYYTGRTCVARREGKEYKFYVKFNDEADIETFREL
ncbi:TA0938 family protein [Metallosphaera tengchongensis]|uniref:TA0938 family protein n=1 Tax=Metallosphaera tengchongensis TaxID=1532350 RepID=A0A6N0NV92_9CREN|nr:TA0938 family protein [Metallosphaera tengchongensis]QKR00652.1 TA0938 family protein [Metallosphaera tengchongensis]